MFSMSWSRPARRAALAAALGLKLGVAYLQVAAALSLAFPFRPLPGALA
jgi:hypothetical protein